MNVIVVATGCFDPIHSGHIQYLKSARELGDKLVVGLNSDAWLERKKGRAFMPFAERKTVIEHLSMVSEVIAFDDTDGTANDAINAIKQAYPNSVIIFANGGDRNNTNIPELDYFEDDLQVNFEFGVGGDHKKNSSSWILDDWALPKTPRIWGHYCVLREGPGYKVKQLVVEPGKTLSLQRHFKRSEHWFVTDGEATVEYQPSINSSRLTTTLSAFNSIDIPVGTWHRLSNSTDSIVKIVEVQFGQECREDDIERQ